MHLSYVLASCNARCNSASVSGDYHFTCNMHSLFLTCRFSTHLNISLNIFWYILLKNVNRFIVFFYKPVISRMKVAIRNVVRHAKDGKIIMIVKIRLVHAKIFDFYSCLSMIHVTILFIRLIHTYFF